MTDQYDLVILGSGSTAFAAAITANELGKTAVMTEARTVGGTCVNRGCLPSKNLIEAAKLRHDARDPRYPGLTGRDLGLDFRTLIAQKDEVIAGYREKKYLSIFDEGHDVPIVRGQARLTGAHTVMVEGPEGTTRLEGEQILVALGSSPVIPAIDGLRDVPYLTSDLLTSEGDLELTALPESLVVIGGGYIAVELGQMFSRFGTKVTLLERGARLLAAYEPEIGLALGDILRAEGLDVRTGARVVRVRPDHAGVVVTAEIDGCEQEVAAARVLVTTGRQPNTAGVGLEDAGVRLDAWGAIAVDDDLRTSVPHIWAAGDIIGAEQDSQMATPVGARDGGIAAHNALSAEAPRRVDHRVIPRAVFTDPPGGRRRLDRRGGQRGGPHVLVQHRLDGPGPARRGDPRHARGHQDGGRRRHERSPRRVDAGRERSRGDPRGGDGAALPRHHQRFHRPLARLSHHGRGAQDRSDLALQRPRQTLMLCRVGMAAPVITPAAPIPLTDHLERHPRSTRSRRDEGDKTTHDHTR